MKKITLLLLLVTGSVLVKAQLAPKVKCDGFVVDVLDGKVNGMKANIGWAELKGKFPCFTSADPEGAESKCGGGVFFKDKDLYFYTFRDYIEIGPKFQGKLSIPLMGANRGGLFKTLGNPKLKDDSWDAYATNYGLLVLHYNKANKIIKIHMTTRPAEELQLCQ